VRPAADSTIVSGVWITEAATVVVVAMVVAALLAGLTTLPIGLGARMLSMVKSEVGDDMVATEEAPAPREETGSRPRGRGVSSEPIVVALLAKRSCIVVASVVVSFPRLAVA